MFLTVCDNFIFIDLYKYKIYIYMKKKKLSYTVRNKDLRKISIVPPIDTSPIQDIISSQITASRLSDPSILISAAHHVPTGFFVARRGHREAMEFYFSAAYYVSIMYRLSCSDVLRSFRPEVSRRRPSTHEEPERTVSTSLRQF